MIQNGDECTENNFLIFSSL